MKAGMHPDYHLINVKLVSGDGGADEVHLGSRRAAALARHRPAVHPAWTGGSSRLMDTGGRVTKFKNKYEGLGF